jgi:hypothetical protein
MCVGHHYPQANTNNINKTRALLQTTGGKDEANIVCMRKSQHGTQNVIYPVFILSKFRGLRN